MNTLVEAADPKDAPLQLPEENRIPHQSIYRRKHAQGISARTPEPNRLVVQSNAIRCPLSELHHRLTRSRQITGNHRTSRRRREMAAETPITGIRQLPDHAGNLGRYSQRRQRQRAWAGRWVDLAGCRKSLYLRRNSRHPCRTTRRRNDSIDERLSAAYIRSRRRQRR